MFSQSFRKLGRCLLAASAVTLGAGALNAQDAAPPLPTAPNPSRIDLFAGYSYLGTNSPVKPAGVNYSPVDVGAIGSGTYWFNKFFGGEISLAAHPDGRNDGIYTAAAGPAVRYTGTYFTVFGHALAGASRVGGPNSDNPSFFYHEPYQWGASLTAGGGMDYDLPYMNHAFAIRVFQADYVYDHVDFGPYNGIPTGGVMGGRANINSVQASTGIVLRLGHIIPPPPVAYSCAVSPQEVFAGDPVTVTGTATNLNPKRTPNYGWSGDQNVKISGTSNVGNIDTTGMNPGTYNVKGHVEEGKKVGQFADCTAQFTIKQPQPPTISCTASPETVAPGDSATITSTANSPQNRPLTYSYSASAGSVSGTTSTATLSTTGVAPGTVTVTCNVVDDKGQNASATTTVTVNAPAPPPAPTTSNLCTVSFDRDHKRPTRVDNEAKACLDDVALNLQRSSDAKLALVGNGKNEKQADERAYNAKQYLVKDKGVDASRVTLYTGTAGDNTVTTTLIPAGATPADMGTAVDESTIHARPEHRHGHAHHHHHKSSK